MAERIYRCSDGHLYASGWAKSSPLTLHLGSGTNFQRCPVDRRWRVARLLDPQELSPAELNEARKHPL